MANREEHSQADDIEDFEDMAKGEITEKKREAAKAMFEGLSEDKTWREIAEDAGVSERYLREIRRQQSFWTVWHDQFDEELEMLLPKAVEALDKAMDRDNRDSSQAAKMIIEALGLTEADQGDNQTIVAIQRATSDNEETDVESNEDTEIVELEGDE